MARWLDDPPPEHVFEISEHALVGACPRNPERQQRERTNEQALNPSPSLPNVIRPQFFREALPKVVSALGSRKPTSALVIPDYAVRMAILDFEDVPPKEDDRLALLRFRLKKSVPFHIDEARLSYSIQESRPGHIEILAVAIANPILQEYEGLFSESGHRVGVVVPSLIAALGFCSAEQGITLLAKKAGLKLSIGLIEQGKLRLVRCLDLSGEGSEDEQSSIRTTLQVFQQTLAFAEDQLEQPVSRAVLCGFGPETGSLGEQMKDEFGIEYAPLQSRFGAAYAENTGLLGLLEQYAA